MTKEDRERIWEWEDVARKALVTPRLSRSEVDTILIGLTRSDNAELKAAMERMREKAWKAKRMK
tara:strand:+ start:2096 stop:2287 length:192 start_codon:yes stop_codon:yes gene_type:complete